MRRQPFAFFHMHELDFQNADASGAAAALHVLGDAWVLRIVRSSFRGTRRFSDFLRSLEVSRAVLTDRLSRLCKDELLQKIELPGAHPEYRLTERGLDLWSVYIAMWKWETHWGTGLDRSTPAHDSPRSRLIHTSCGKAIDPIYQCDHCGAEVSPFDTHACQPPASIASGQTVGQMHVSEDASGRRYRKSSSNDRSTLPTLQKVYGDRWNASLMAAAFKGCKTFSEFSGVTGIWPTALTDRLEELQSMGMLRARSYAGSRQEYRLTRAAVATFPITLELMRWGDRWLTPSGTRIQVMHRLCEHVLHAQWHCPVCREPLQRQTILLE